MIDLVKRTRIVFWVPLSVSHVESGIDFNSALQLADDRMYAKKNNKKSIDWLRILS